jgi:hypothetical protein
MYLGLLVAVLLVVLDLIPSYSYIKINYIKKTERGTSGIIHQTVKNKSGTHMVLGLLVAVLLVNI